jgi:hypothetical protein
MNPANVSIFPFFLIHFSSPTVCQTSSWIVLLSTPLVVSAIAVVTSIKFEHPNRK